MLRYKVTVVAPGDGPYRPVLVVPFPSEALVTAFIDELFKRVGRLHAQLQPDTYVAALHLDSEAGAILDCEDLLSDVIDGDEKEKLFMVLQEKDVSPLNTTQATSTHATVPNETVTTPAGDNARIRIITPARARDGAQDAHCINVPITSSLRECHSRIAAHLAVSVPVDEMDAQECNCKLASKLADDPCPLNQILVVDGKSQVQHVNVIVPTELGIKQVLRSTFGSDLEDRKKVMLIGGEKDRTTPTLYIKPPVVGICSKQRHIPPHARTDVEESSHIRSTVLDLHSMQLPIHPAAMDSTIQASGLLEMSQNETTVFAVIRSKSAHSTATIGKNAIFRSRAHWEPNIEQSDRGVAMFLSSLRVFVSLVGDMKDDERAQDAVLHVIDLLTKFPPAVRTMHILIQGNTPSSTECAALTHAMFELLDSFMPTSLVGSDQTRNFEGSRLLFGFILEKARALKLAGNLSVMPYLSSFESIDIRDYKTFEPTFRAVLTEKGLMERALFAALRTDGLLSRSDLQDFPVEIRSSDTRVCTALLSGGIAGEVLAFFPDKLRSDYGYSDAGNVEAAIDLGELSQLEHLAELSGRNKLAVHRPSQLTSAVTPCLTFDREAHVSVYTGEQPCGEPGQSSLIFRPQQGETTVDTAVVEQLIAPILKQYEADGSAVLDAIGGAAVRRLQQPDEILMFCVDCSASMRLSTDFDEVNDEDIPSNPESDAQSLVAGEYYNWMSLDEVKDRLCKYDSFKDMVAMVAETRSSDRSSAALRVLQLLRNMLSTQIVQKSKDLESLRQRTHVGYAARTKSQEMENELITLKELWAGLKTHETAVGDFLTYRALNDSRDITHRWTWSLNDPTPAIPAAQQLPTLANDITSLPEGLKCPISHGLMEDAVTSSDGFDYARTALTQWFSIRKSSPMTGLPLVDTSMRENRAICEAAAAWVRGDDLQANGVDSPARGGWKAAKKRLRSSEQLKVVFASRIGSFTRKVSPSATLRDLYELVFRGLKGSHAVFQLSSERCGTIHPSSSTLISATQLENGHVVTVRIADDEPTCAVQGSASTAPAQTSEACLVKVYETTENMLFAFWTNRQTNTQSLSSLLWKYWRWTFSRSGYVPHVSDKQIWTDMSNSGDGLLRGTPRKSTEKLAKFLTGMHCFGKLAPEKVYRDDQDIAGQSPLVLKVWVASPWREGARRSRLTRLDVLKQMFEATINRTVAYNFKTHVGLISVGSTPTVSMNISHVIENLRKATNEMQSEGDTALWDALSLARELILEYGKKYPNAKKRIICISDGKDTTSKTNTPQDICWRLREAEIHLDTVALGSEDNADLKTISHLLGCYILEPKSIVNALAMCEMEPFLSSTERPSILPPNGTPRARLPFVANFWNARRHASATKVTEDTVPPIRKHPRLDDDFVELIHVSTASRSRIANSSETSRSRPRTSRLMNEIKAIVANAADRTYDIYVSETDFSFWKVVMRGPEGSPYSAGTFLLYLHAPEDYPTFAPKARFLSKIRHPNVNPNGRICHSIFDRDWTSDVSMTTLLDTVYGLLLQPEASDPVNTTITLGFHRDQVEFADEVRAHVQRHALKTREDWKVELLGEVEHTQDDEMEDEGASEMHEGR